ncbi:ion channel [Natronococcus occultus]|uniref:ion channel n=1 Tax=Natronococcus occultus TaxID=29288 RepID=UPI0006782E8B|nr:ion channel [Natronococcus occultus]
MPDEVDELKALRQALNDAGNSPRDDRPEHRGQFVGAKFGAIHLFGFPIEATEDYDIRFDHARFHGENADLRFVGTKFATSGQYPVSFYGAKFITEGDCDILFDGANFITKGDGDVLFEDAEFITEGDGDVRFKDVEFATEGNGDVRFKDAEFITRGDGDVRFEDAEFDGNTFFEDVDFDATSRFVVSQIERTAMLSFEGADFYEPFFFNVSNDIQDICGDLDFSYATFHDEVDFRSDDDRSTSHSSPAGQCPTFSFNSADSVDFSNTKFIKSVDFSDANFPADTTFDGARLSGANFVEADLSGASLERAQLNRAELLGTKLVGAKLYGALLGNARIDRETRIWPEAQSLRRISGFGKSPVDGGVWRRLRAGWRGGRVPYCCYDPRYWGPSGTACDSERDMQERLEKAAEMYGTVETVARDNSLPRLASECFLGRKDVQLRQYWLKDDDEERQWLMTIQSFIPSLVARYGESPWRVLGTGTFIVLVCGLAYWAFELIERTGETGGSATLLESIYFSSLTFTTLGYGDFRPVNRAGQFLAVAETAMGVILLAILVFVFGRRATR